MKLLLSVALLLTFIAIAVAQQPLRSSLPADTLLRIVQAEDMRSWNSDLESLLADQDAQVRSRAALAAGRIGDAKAVPALVTLLKNDSARNVRAMAAFALGEIESPNAADALIATLDLYNREDAEIRARAIEALGKIVATLPKAEEARAIPMRKAIFDTLDFEGHRRGAADDNVVLLGLTAALRAKPDKVGEVVAHFLKYSDARIRADAANTLARLKLNDGNEKLRELLSKDPDPIVRANAARVLGATEDKDAFEGLQNRATKDGDLRVRVSAIRALASLKDTRAVRPLLEHGRDLLASTRRPNANQLGLRSEINELNEIAAALGRLVPNSNDALVIDWLREARQAAKLTAPEIEIALARVAPQTYRSQVTNDLKLVGVRAIPPAKSDSSARTLSSLAQGLEELAALKSNDPLSDASIKIYARNLLLARLECRDELPARSAGAVGVRQSTVLVALCTPLPERARPAFLRAYAAFKASDAAAIYERYLQENDVIVRATAAEALGEMAPDEAKTNLLVEALPRALADRDLNDAAVAILDALGKQKTAKANEAIKSALASRDLEVRRKAVALLKTNGVGDFSERIGSIKTLNSTADHRRALARIGKDVRATVNTSKGAFVIQFIPEEAPLTVDNFVMLARKGYFNGQIVPRVVPNFVIQTGDPRGDQNGGPGYSIRCEINEARYDRGAVGMALSGKDTGGSQWFVTHSPQPHLDGGYTVFGNVISGMDVVDKIVRGDTVKSITISETISGMRLKSVRKSR
jgi:cyclophilin family peptidyl-prolyl cis-trans isomerase/HEAT repeat protein